MLLICTFQPAWFNPEKYLKKTILVLYCFLQKEGHKNIFVIEKHDKLFWGLDNIKNYFAIQWSAENLRILHLTIRHLY